MKEKIKKFKNINNAEYEKELELKYSKYGKSFIESYERELISKGSGLEGIIGEHLEWEEFFSDWNNWTEKEKKEYLYFLTYFDGKEYYRWFFWFSVIVAILIGFSIGIIL